MRSVDELTGALAPHRSGMLAAPGAPEHDDLPPRHLRDYLRVLIRHRRLALTCFGSVVALTLLVTLVMPRRYTATERLQVARQSPIQLRLEDNVRRLDDGESTRNQVDVFLGTQIATLRSRDLAARVMRTWGLTTEDALTDGAPASLGAVVSELRPRGWKDADGNGTAPAVAAAAAADDVDPRLVDRYVEEYLSVREVRGTDLIDVSFTTPDPRLSAFLTAAHTQAYLETNEDARRATDNLANRFLDDQLARARGAVERAQSSVDRFARKHPNVAINQEQQTLAARIAEVSSLLTKAEATRTSLESRYDFLSNGKSAPAYLQDTPGVQKLRLALLDVRSQRAAVAGRLGANHPRMQELARLESEVNGQLRAEVSQGVKAIRAHYRAAALREERLRRQVDDLQRTGIKLRALGGRYDVLKADLDAARKLHDSLLRQRADTAVTAQLAASNVRVVERAEVPLWPSRPKILLNLVLGVLAGLVLAIGAALGRDYFDGSVKATDDVEETLGLPALAVIPSFADDAPGRRMPYPRLRSALHLSRPVEEEPTVEHTRERELVVVHAPWSAGAEAFRSMRTAVLFAGGGEEPRVLLVTSAASAEGKTVASLNLASTLGESGARVLLIDADLRHPRCHTALGVSNERGFSNVLRGEHVVEDVVHALVMPRVYVMPAGPPPPNPADLLGSPRVGELFAGLRDRYDFVVLDTPPVLPVTDAAVLARLADGVVLIVKSGGTSRVLARRARDRLFQVGARFLGVLVNDVRPEWGEVIPGYPYRYPNRPSGAAATGNAA
jgi:polysaccharide biosynthesis transport protein